MSGGFGLSPRCALLGPDSLFDQFLSRPDSRHRLEAFPCLRPPLTYEAFWPAVNSPRRALDFPQLARTTSHPLLASQYIRCITSRFIFLDAEHMITIFSIFALSKKNTFAFVADWSAIDECKKTTHDFPKFSVLLIIRLLRNFLHFNVKRKICSSS